MKRLILSALLLLASTLQLAAQEGKPLYAIDVYRADTTLGRFTVELFADIAPLHVRNFDSLVSIGFFDSTAFHRVIPGFVIQGGDPNTKHLDQSTWGIGDTSQTEVPAEFNPISHRRGILSAARSEDPNSATSQFFVCVAAATSLDRRYTVYGRVTSGMNIVDSIVNAPTELNQFAEKSRPITKIIMRVTRIGLDTTVPGAVTLIAPGDDTTRVRASQDLRWTAVPDAILYEVQLSKTEDFAVIALKDSVVTTSATISPLEAGHQTYYWRVRASNGGRRGAFSEVRSFTTGLAKAVLVSPTNSATGVVKPVTLTWGAVDGATSYRVQLATTIGFTTLIVDTAGLTTPSVTIAGLPPSTRVFWRVRSSDAVGDTTESSRWNFTTDATASLESDATALLTMTARAGDHVELDITSARDETADIQIVDALGRVVRRWSTHVRAGRSVVTIPGAELTTGAYFGRVAVGDRGAACRFVVK